MLLMLEGSFILSWSQNVYVFKINITDTTHNNISIHSITTWIRKVTFATTQNNKYLVPLDGRKKIIDKIMDELAKYK